MQLALPYNFKGGLGVDEVNRHCKLVFSRYAGAVKKDAVTEVSERLFIPQAPDIINCLLIPL